MVQVRHCQHWGAHGAVRNGVAQDGLARTGLAQVDLDPVGRGDQEVWPKIRLQTEISLEQARRFRKAWAVRKH